MASPALRLQPELPPLRPLPKAVLHAPKAIFDAIDDQHGLLRIHGSLLFHTVDLDGGGGSADVRGERSGLGDERIKGNPWQWAWGLGRKLKERGQQRDGGGADNAGIGREPIEAEHGEG